jgi:nicotinamidase-related amidase
LLDPTDAVLLLLDHQSGLFQSVKDISVAELRANTTMLAKLATLVNLPLITTASEPNGPNGPLMPEIHASAPHARAKEKSMRGTTSCSSGPCAKPARRH